MEPNSTSTDTAIIDTHTTVLIKDHETKFDDLFKQGEERKRRLTKLEKRVEDDNTLIFDTLGIKLKDNGERKKQIAHALDRISKIETREEYKEHKEETIFAMVYETRETLARLEGYIDGSNKATEQKERLWNKNYNYVILVIAIVSIGFAYFQVRGGFHL